MEYMITEGNRPRIVHKRTGAYLELAKKCTGGWCVAMVETPKAHRGKGIGTNLHALAMMWSHATKRPLSHFGVRVNENLPVPRSTQIARKLGFRNVGGNYSVFDPAVNSLDKALKRLGISSPGNLKKRKRSPGSPRRRSPSRSPPGSRYQVRALPGNQRTPGRPSHKSGSP
jgi:hypothetical protein